MILTELALVDFRNFPAAEVRLGPGLTVIEGRNAQGKSNLLEATFVFGALQPLRARTLRELTRLGAGGLRVQGRVAEDPSSFAVVVRDGKPRLFTRDRAIPRERWVPGGLRPVSLAPEDIALAQEAGDPRRRYLDELAAAFVAGHETTLARARRILVQRSRALAEGVGAEAWEEPLIDAYVALAAARRAAAEALHAVLPAVMSEFAGPEKAEVTYRPTVALLAQPVPDAEGAEAVRGALAGLRAREVAAGLCLVGPHRDEVQFWVDGRDARRDASRGQQRTLALALRIAAAEAIRRRGGAEPLLLVDDVLPELDEGRQRRVLCRVLAAPQALLTTAERPRALAGVEAARWYRVDAGQICPRV